MSIQCLPIEKARQLSEEGKAKFNEMVEVEAAAMAKVINKRIESATSSGAMKIEHEFSLKRGLSRMACTLMTDMFTVSGYNVEYITTFSDHREIKISVSWEK